MRADDVLLELATRMNWDVSEFLGFVASEEARQQYEKYNLDAHQRGIFGVPTMIIDDEMWWGNDRLMFVEEYIEAQVSQRLCRSIREALPSM
ncbi:MAG: DsbA family protein [Rhodospirillales bacterium]|nr:DsbA family protein [Rhodospirillales bacterium]